MTGEEETVIAIGAVLWFAHGWYLNERLKDVRTKLDRVLEQFNGLREYLYEIDPQFDDERASDTAFEKGDSLFAGMDDMELLRHKEANGKRTLNTPFINHHRNICMSRPKSEIAADLRQMKESALWIERIENKGNFIEQEFEKFKSAAARLKEDVGGESFSGLFNVDNKCDHQPLIKYLEDRL